MALYAIGDLHLSFGSEKPMDVFGGAWEGYVDKLLRGFEGIEADDTVVLCGDISWADSLKGSLKDFQFISALPGKKVILKGNHDYWWTTASKTMSFLNENGLSGISILHNNFILYENTALCGTRGWFFEDEPTAADEKIYKRELIRIETSLKKGQESGAEQLIAFLHYPPLTKDYSCDDIKALLEKYRVKICCYGHLHGKSQRRAYEGELNGIEYRLVAADYIGFTPVRIL